jgi:hypothetical protein
MNDIFGMWWRRPALCLWGIGQSEPEGEEHPTIPGPTKCTNAQAIASSRWRNLHHQRRQCLAHFNRDYLVAGLDQLSQLAGVSGPLRRDDADLG